MTSSPATRTIERARNAQSELGQRNVSQRCKYLERLRRAIAAECESIAAMIAHETSKPLLDALSGDVMVTLEMLRYYEAQAPKILQATRLGKPTFFFPRAQFEMHWEPRGVALIFGPSNYPFQLSMVPLITALAAGNSVVLKVSERTPETAALISRLCAQAELPANLVQVLHGEPAESIALIDAQPDIVFFTGSSQNGRMVAERAARHLIPAILELGGKDAALVFADCNVERAVEGITYGAFANAGRVCVGTKRVLIEDSIYERFVLLLRERIARLNVAPTLGADLCPISAQESALLRAQVEDALARGARLQWPPDRTDLGRRPVLLTSVPRNTRLLMEETFGPVLCVASFRDEAEALSLANASEFALSSSVWTNDRQRARRLAAELAAASCAVNDVLRIIANPHAPFGGNRLSGYGRYHGPEGLRAFSRSKTLMIADSRRTREINWFPFTDRTSKQLARLLRFRHSGIGTLGRLVRFPALLLAACFLTIAAQAQFSTRVNHSITRIHHGPDCRLLGNAREGVGASNSSHPLAAAGLFGESSPRTGERTQTLMIWLVPGI